MEDSKIVLRDLAVALGVLVLVLAGLFGWLVFGRTGPQFSRVFANPNVPKTSSRLTAEPENETPPAQKPETPEPEDIPRFVVSRHTVVGGESFSLITGMYWDDMFLWPDLWIHNDMISDDPDLIFPDEIVDIYNRLGKGDTYTAREKELILDAYIQVYDKFKALGPEKDGSAWTLLWCGAKYDHNFLNLYAHRIDPKDLAVAQRYIDEEGYLD